MDFAPSEEPRMSFAEKVHALLTHADKQEADAVIVSWMPHGRAFKVHKPALFDTDLCQRFFGHGRYSSFVRSLNSYGFKHISTRDDRNCKYLYHTKHNET